MAQSVTGSFSPAFDMELAFKTRVKLAVAKIRDGADLRRTVLLCNTYDAFQRSMAEHFELSRSRFSEAIQVEDEKPRIYCREIVVMDAEEYDDDSDEDDDTQAGLDTTLILQQPPSIVDDETPPPYELHADPIMPDQNPQHVAKLEDSEDLARSAAVEEDVDVEPSEIPTSNTATCTVSSSGELAKLEVLTTSHTQHIEVVVLDSKSPAPSIPKRIRPSLAHRVSFGHRMLGLPREPAHGSLEVH